MKSKRRAVALFGPTAVGKTALTEEFFSEGFEIINADSIQVYKGFDIGSAKPSAELQRKIPHHLVDIMDPHQQYTVGDFCKDAEALIDEICSRGNVPLITGGTAYYFRQLLYGPSSAPAADPAVRLQIQDELKRCGRDALYQKLLSLDSAAAMRISSNDEYRITRALEVIYQTGRPLSSFSVSEDIRKDIDFLSICLIRPKDELERRIRLRVGIMFEEGLYEELKRLFREGADRTWPAMQGIGYKEFLDYKESGELSLPLLKKEIERTSIQYAKRQMTFFRSFRNVHFVSPDDHLALKTLLDSFL